MKQIGQEVVAVLSVVNLRRKLFVAFTLGLMAASLLINVGILAFVTEGLPSAFVLNDGSMEVQATLDDPVDQFLDEAVPLYNYPFAWFAFPKVLTFTNEYGFTETLTQEMPLFLNIHYFVDFAPFALLISTYMAMNRHYFSSIKSGVKNRGSIIAGSASTIAPSASSGATTALTAVAAGICCGGFAVESSVVFLGFAVSAAGFVLLSRVFMLAMAGFLIWGIWRASRKINGHCALPSVKA